MPKYNNRRKARLGLDIREGGIAIPIANNMWYIHGRKHEYGGVTMGPNNKNGVEVEGGEVVKVGNKDIKVFSSVPLLRGVSPAQLVMGGANPDTVFKAQEDFKDKNRINDDGTRYEIGGEKNISINNLPSSFRGRKIGNSYYQVGFPPALSKAKSWNNKFSHHLNSLNVELKQFGNDILLLGRNAIPKYGKKYYDKAIGKVKEVFMSGETADINNNAQRLGRLSALFNTDNDKKEFGGNMIYSINGNIKNGLSLRPKAKYGTIDRKNKDEKVGPDGLIYKRAADGEWYTDGTKHVTYKPINKNSREDLYYANPVQGLYHDAHDGNFVNVSSIVPDEYEIITRKFDKPKRTYVGGYDEEEKETKKIGSLTYEKNESGKWVPSAKQSTTTTRDGGRPKDFGMTRTGVNHPNGNYKYHPLTGEKVSEIGVVETSEPSVKSTTKVTSKSNSTPRGSGTKASTPKAAAPKTTTKGADVKYGTPLKEKKESLYMTGIKNNSVTPLKAGMEKAPKNSNNEGNDKTGKNIPWIGQYKTFRPEDWVGLGTNLAGHVAGYFANNSLLKKYPMPVKPVLFQAAKLKTTHNINPKLASSRETEQMNLAEVGRNTSSSSTSIARKQRIMNEARDARNKLYGEKENVETQLINLDRRNRQDVYNRNISAYNDWLDKTYVAKTNKLLEKQRNMMSLINGIPSAVNHTLGVIETRRNANNAYRAIAAANPDADARQIGGFDYYEGIGPDGTHKALYDKHQRFVRYI